MAREDAIFYLVAGSAPIAALVKDRIYRVEFPQGVLYPALAYRLIDAPRDEELLGPNGLVDARLQFDALANSYEDASAVRDWLIALLNGYEGFVQGFEIIHSHFEDERDIPYDVATKSRGVQLDFIISHRE
jgi:hypothetical protein